ncbi:class I SAM-dependent DNA methyltransferase [Jiangella mangrovi]|uniref:SAM-dependent methyltransferase n=1 Tax=Jiangella mangrovi TaxID=1524084 RepID=A0A7W9GM56_9ACTN|nr:class I SAM-dependent methyltransferase [Jiangella mangrovi]MBB5786410.1 SAM-dependent methyltransferase [Jiangella mangrovi]
MTGTLPFRAVYHTPDVYDRVLLPHWFDGAEDTGHVRALMHRCYGPAPASGRMRILELGCGTGRVTAALAPYASSLHGVDSGAPMLDVFRTRYPLATTQLADIAAAVECLHADGERFDIVGAFWSLSYPIGDCFEDLTTDGIRPRPDLAAGVADAKVLVRKIVDLLAHGGHLIALFFDSDAPEQRVVTRAWERIAPFPGTGRGFGRETLLAALRDAEEDGLGRLTHFRTGGLSVAPDPPTAIDWFTIVHLKSMPALVDDPDIRAEIEAFVHQHTIDDGRVLLPTGMHLIDFWRTPRTSHLPNDSAGTRGVDP